MTTQALVKVQQRQQASATSDRKAENTNFCLNCYKVNMLHNCVMVKSVSAVVCGSNLVQIQSCTIGTNLVLVTLKACLIFINIF